MTQYGITLPKTTEITETTEIMSVFLRMGQVNK